MERNRISRDATAANHGRPRNLKIPLWLKYKLQLQLMLAS